MVASIVWAIRHRVLRFHPLVFVLIVVGGAVYLALPRIMFDTYMTDQRVPHRRRLHAVRLRRSGTAPPPGAARLP